jgi:hypothetical protein
MHFYALKMFRTGTIIKVRLPVFAPKHSRMTASEEPQRLQTAAALFIRHYEFLKCCCSERAASCAGKWMADFKAKWLG